MAVSAADGAVYAGTEPSASIGRTTAGNVARARESPRAALTADVELPAEAVDVARALDRSSPHEADTILAGIELGGLDALDGPGRELARTTGPVPSQTSTRSRGTPGYEIARTKRAAAVQRGATTEVTRGIRRTTDETGTTPGRSPPTPTTPSCGTSASSGPLAHGRGDPQAHIYRRRNGGWDALAGGLPDLLPSMPYALVATTGRLFAGLAGGELWESRDRGDTWQWCELLGKRLGRLLALAAVAD